MREPTTETVSEEEEEEVPVVAAAAVAAASEKTLPLLPLLPLLRFAVEFSTAERTSASNSPGSIPRGWSHVPPSSRR